MRVVITVKKSKKLEKFSKILRAGNLLIYSQNTAFEGDEVKKSTEGTSVTFFVRGQIGQCKNQRKTSSFGEVCVVIRFRF